MAPSFNAQPDRSETGFRASRENKTDGLGAPDAAIKGGSSMWPHKILVSFRVVIDEGVVPEEEI